ncbi:hypothetical protein [Cryptosporangium sp. NPDC048952]|uniref:hypothetical protein n=1 Tax=Cryptosporangium sp. NPDC048952 TaxID=3363961 RepID=UPI00370FB2CF
MRTLESLSGTGRGRLITIWAVVVVVLLLIAVVVNACTGPDDKAPVPSGTVAGGSPTPESDGVVPDLPPNNPEFSERAPLRLPRGEREAEGVQVGFPQSQAGAVAAAIEYGTAITSTLDLDRAPAVLRAVSDGSYGSDGASLRAAPEFWRQQLGLPTTGPVPAGASLSFVVSAYQVKDRESDRVTVLTLGYVTGTTATRAPQSFLVLFPVLLVWAGDWKLQKRPDDAPDYADLRLAPDTPAAAAAGWREYTR